MNIRVVGHEPIGDGACGTLNEVEGPDLPVEERSRVIAFAIWLHDAQRATPYPQARLNLMSRWGNRK
jgi:hypothetical protein